MGIDSKIEWCNHTLNFWMGCTKVSAACVNCYMYRAAKRYGFDPSVVKRTSNATWRQPLAKARATGEYKWKPGSKIFVCSWSDFFHQDADEWQHEALTLMMARPDLTWMILTKRAELAVDFFVNHYSPSIIRTVIPNLSLGVTVESNEQRWRIEELLKLRDYAKVLFVSYEPALGELDLDEYIPQKSSDGIYLFPNEKRLDWIIVGAETGPNARRMNSSWALSIMNRCESNQLPFFFKRDSDGSRLLDGVKREEWPELTEASE